MSVAIFTERDAAKVLEILNIEAANVPLGGVTIEIHPDTPATATIKVLMTNEQLFASIVAITGSTDPEVQESLKPYMGERIK